MTKIQKISVLFAVALLVLWVTSSLIMNFLPNIGQKLQNLNIPSYFQVTFILVFNGIFSWVCYRMAKRRNLPTEKWAKLGFFFTIWAAIWLYFFEETE